MNAQTPNGLVLNTVNSSQSYKRLTVVDVVSFMEYRKSLEDKAIILRHREEPGTGLIIKPADNSRYFEGGRRKTKRNIRKRFGKFFSAPGTFLTMTYEHDTFTRWDAWRRVSKDVARMKHGITMRYRRAGRKSPSYICVIEEQKKTGYPHVHMFFPRLHWLLNKDVVQDLWHVGRTRVEYADNVNVGGYVCKYVTKMGGWSDEALAFIWKNKMRMYSYSRSYCLPAEEKKPGEWFFACSTNRDRIIGNLNHIKGFFEGIINLDEYLDGLSPCLN